MPSTPLACNTDGAAGTTPSTNNERRLDSAAPPVMDKVMLAALPARSFIETPVGSTNAASLATFRGLAASPVATT